MNWFNEKMIESTVSEILPNEVLFAVGDEAKITCASIWINKLEKEIELLKNCKGCQAECEYCLYNKEMSDN